MTSLLPCRGCLGALGSGSRVGLCGRCWSGLVPLPEERCGRCAIPHGWGEPCPEPVAWHWGDALWDYHGGRPPLGALLVPGIKRGERGWKAALLERAAREPLPPFVWEVDLVCGVPTALLRRLRRGFDLAGEWAEGLGRRLGKPVAPLLRKPWFAPPQAGLPESRRRRLPASSVRLARPLEGAGRVILLVDDVWTTGTTLLRCAQALTRGGANEVRVLTLFRAWNRHRGRAG